MRKKKSTVVGDFVKNWQFDRTDVGKQFYIDFGHLGAKPSLDRLADQLNQAIKDFIDKRLQEGAQKLLGDKASFEIVHEVIAHVADQATRMVQRFTTITPLMNASKAFFEVCTELPGKLAGATGDEAKIKVIEEASAAFWHKLPHIAIKLFKDMETVKTQIAQELRTLPDTALTPLTDAADAMYALQMRALNSVRTQFVVSLKAKIAQLSTKEECELAVRSVFREFVFKNTQVLVNDAWCAVAEAIIQSAFFQVMAKFDEKIWVHIQPTLAALQAAIPAPLASAGLQIDPLAHQVAALIIEKPTRWVVTKLVIKLEEILFNQAENV